jgi:hypothetical protein
MIIYFNYFITELLLFFEYFRVRSCIQFYIKSYYLQVDVRHIFFCIVFIRNLNKLIMKTIYTSKFEISLKKCYE